MAMTETERRLFDKARDKIIEQQELLEKLTMPSYHLGMVIGVFDKSVIVDTNGQIFELQRTDATEIRVGMGVNIHPKTGQIVRLSEFVSYGATGTVMQTDGKLVQVSIPSGVITTEYSLVPVAKGDKVVLNSTNHVIMRKLTTQSQYAFRTQAVLDWCDIGACEEAKTALIDALETPYTHADLFNYFHKKQVKGGLLWGRAGNGKTLLGRGAAGALARMHQKQAADSGFLYIKGPEILDKFVGETEGQIREAFAYGRAHFIRWGYPCVLFVDEADAVLMRRGSRTASGMEMTIVPQFLSEMDGIEDSGVFVLLATNRADTLDPAVIRPGRVDRKIYVAPPNVKNAPEIWNIHMKNVPTAKDVSKEQLIQTTNDILFSEQYPLYLIDTPAGRKTFSLGNLVSGAQIAGIVERASAIGINRNIVSGGDPTGLTQDDFNNALTAMHKEQYGMNHFDELREFIDTQKLEVSKIEQCHDGAVIAKPAPAPQSAQQVVVLPKKGYDA